MSTPVRIPKSSSSPIAKASSKSPQTRAPASSSSSPKAVASTSKSSTPRRQSRPDLMSSSLKSQDDYLVYEIPSGDPDVPIASVVIIPRSSQGFSWNEDVFLSKYQMNLASPQRLSGSMDSYRSGGDSLTGSSDDGREEDFVDVHEIHIANDDTDRWWDDLA